MKTNHFTLLSIAAITACLFSVNTFAAESKQATSTVKQQVVFEYKEYKEACEAIDGLSLDVESLNKSSIDAKKKIKSLEKTLEEESVKREGILANIKSILSLKKTDKQVLSEMKKTINKAYSYYLEIDEVVIDNQSFVEEVESCKKLELESVLDRTHKVEELLSDEAAFRKELTSVLKEKVKTVSKEIEKSTKKDK
jgi:hypothetical protein